MSNFTIYSFQQQIEDEVDRLRTTSTFNDIIVNDSLILSNKLYFVSRLADFPTPAGNVIDLPALTTWYIIGDIDLTGNRLNCLGNVTITGTSSETSSLTSTGLPGGEALLSSASTLPVRFITFGCPSGTSVFDLNSDGTNGIDMQSVNFGSNTLSVGSIGTIQNYSNFVMFNCAVLNVENGWTFDGSIGTIAFNQTLFGATLNNGNAHITLSTTLIITRRFRAIYSSFIVTPGRIGIDVVAGVTIPNSNFILDTINFSSTGTFLQGIDETDNRSLFTSCVGIPNSAEQGEMTMQGNGTSTTITITGDYYKAAGTTTASTLNQKFTHTDNRLTYVGTVQLNFYIAFVVTVSSGNNKDVGLRLAKNGTTIVSTTNTVTTNGIGRAESVKIQSFQSMTTNDFIELFVTNTTDTTAVTIVDLNGILFGLN